LHPAERLRKIFTLAKQFTVELETHPVNSEEYIFLSGGEIFRWVSDLRTSISHSHLPPQAKQLGS
jgi:hypothetical protein